MTLYHFYFPTYAAASAKSLVSPIEYLSLLNVAHISPLLIQCNCSYYRIQICFQLNPKKWQRRNQRKPPLDLPRKRSCCWTISAEMWAQNRRRCSTAMHWLCRQFQSVSKSHTIPSFLPRNGNEKVMSTRHQQYSLLKCSTFRFCFRLSKPQLVPIPIDENSNSIFVRISIKFQGSTGESIKSICCRLWYSLWQSPVWAHIWWLWHTRTRNSRWSIRLRWNGKRRSHGKFPNCWPMTRKPIARRRTNARCGRRTKWPTMRRPPLPFSTTMPCSWPSSSSLVSTFCDQPHHWPTTFCRWAAPADCSHCSQQPNQHKCRGRCLQKLVSYIIFTTQNNNKKQNDK